MKDNEKQIKEIRKDLVEIFDEEYNKRGLITADFTAKKLVDLNYQKISEDNIVLSKAEYKELSSIVETIRKQVIQAIRKEIAESYKTSMMLVIQEMVKYLELTDEQAKILYHHNNDICKQFTHHDIKINNNKGG